MDILELLTYIAPGKEWSLVGKPTNEAEYVEAITWFSEGSAPTWNELQAAKPKAEYDVNYAAVQEARRAQYQLISDPLFFGWQRGDNTEAEWLDAVQAVKDANPYPSIES